MHLVNEKHNGTSTSWEEPDADSRTVVLIPAYNEERFIGSVVLQALQLADTVVVVDDGSSDATAEIAEAAGAVVVRHEQNQGKGVALNTGFGKARELNADAVITIDGDGQHVTKEAIDVVRPILSGEADIVVGSRYLVNTSDVPRHRVIGHSVFNLMGQAVSGIALTDSQSGFRAFSRRALSMLSFQSSSFSVESEMQLMAREHALRMVEVPIKITYLDKPKRSVVAHGLIVLNGILQLVGQYRPLLFFGLPGVALLLLGLVWGAWVVEIYRTSQVLAIGYTLLSIMLVLLGNLSLFTGIILHSVRGLLVDLVRPRDF